MHYRSFLRSAFALIGLAISITSASCQTPVDTTNNSCVVLRIDYCSNWITTCYGGEKKTEVKLERSKQLPIKDQISTINNLLADHLNKLVKEGYKIVSGISDVNDGSTCGLTYILCK